MPQVVESAIKVKVMLPKIIYKGKLGIDDEENRSIAVKTIAITTIMSKGFKTLHNTPKSFDET